MPNREADFSAKTKSTVEYLCRNKCSNPDCRKETTELSSEGRIYSIGKACHIEAASPKGPRYNPQATLEQRKSIDNVIWLCSICADKIDRDVEKYTTELLKRWKYRAEKTHYNDGTRVFVIANEAGGVGNSSVTAYLTQAVANITKEKVLCISVNAYNDAGKILFGYEENNKIKCDDIVSTDKTNVDYMGDNAVREAYINHIADYGKEWFDDLRSQYRYIFVDCGNGGMEEKVLFFHMATDVIVPIGEHVHTDIGMKAVGKWLSERREKVSVWPVWSIGLKASNKKYSRFWLQKVWKAINQIAVLECTEVKVPTVIIPKSCYLQGRKPDIEKYAKTRHVAEAYLAFANEVLGRN